MYWIKNIRGLRKWQEIQHEHQLEQELSSPACVGRNTRCYSRVHRIKGMANYVNLKILIDNEETTRKCNGHEMKTLSIARGFYIFELLKSSRLKCKIYLN